MEITLNAKWKYFIIKVFRAGFHVRPFPHLLGAPRAVLRKINSSRDSSCTENVWGWREFKLITLTSGSPIFSDCECTYGWAQSFYFAADMKHTSFEGLLLYSMKIEGGKWKLMAISWWLFSSLGNCGASLVCKSKARMFFPVISKSSTIWKRSQFVRYATTAAA